MGEAKFNVFLSYTSREPEVKFIQPLVDRYCFELWQWARALGVYIFYDHFSLPQGQYISAELEEALSMHIKRSQLFTAFLSPSYFESNWCQFEWERMVKNKVSIVHPIYWKPDIGRYIYAGHSVSRF